MSMDSLSTRIFLAMVMLCPVRFKKDYGHLVFIDFVLTRLKTGKILCIWMKNVYRHFKGKMWL